MQEESGVGKYRSLYTHATHLHDCMLWSLALSMNRAKQSWDGMLVFSIMQLEHWLLTMDQL